MKDFIERLAEESIGWIIVWTSTYILMCSLISLESSMGSLTSVLISGLDILTTISICIIGFVAGYLLLTTKERNRW